MLTLWKTFLLFLLSSLLINISNEAAENVEGLAAKDLTQTSLFVSLGSVCTPANFTRLCGIRTASFPFDWIVSMDGEKFIEILEDDFLHFFNMEYLIRDNDFLQNVYNAPVNGNVLLNTYYHLEFLHEEGNWRTQFFSTMQTFGTRYKRRIARFRNLRTFPGKVFFMRSAYPTDDPHRFFRFKENNEISEEYSFRLYNALKRYFPNLDFTLIIMNFHENDKEYVAERELADNLLIINAPLINGPDKIEIYKNYFYGLMEERSLLPNEALGLY
jgi:hypothetical protein